MIIRTIRIALKMIKKTFKVSGMHCPSCVMLIEGELEDQGARARCDLVKNEVAVEYPEELGDEGIRAAIEAAGYAVSG